jgi:hypothetical protein
MDLLDSITSYYVDQWNHVGTDETDSKSRLEQFFRGGFWVNGMSKLHLLADSGGQMRGLAVGTCTKFSAMANISRITKTSPI